VADIRDLIKDRILKLAVSRLAHHPAILDRLRTEFETRSQATLQMTSSISPFEWSGRTQSDHDSQQVDQRLLGHLDQWISCQPEMFVPLEITPLPPAGAPPAPKAAVVDQVQAGAPNSADAPPHPTTWSLIKPKKFPGYRNDLFKFLSTEHQSDADLPKASRVLETWKIRPPAGFTVGRDEFTYTLDTGKPKNVSLKNLARAIDGLVKLDK